jgi:zinc transporter ZupT
VAASTLCLMLWLHRFGHTHAMTAHGQAPAHDHDGHGHRHGHDPHGPHEQSADVELSLHDARMAVAGLALHSLLDGVAVSAALANQRSLGLFVAFFVLLHKLPEGAAAAALTYASGGQSSAAKRSVLTVAAASLVGALAVFVVGPVLTYALAVTAGVTTGVGLGIASHLRRQRARDAIFGVGGGLLLFAVAEWLLHG